MSLINERDIVQEAGAVEEVLTGEKKNKKKTKRVETEQNGGRIKVEVPKFALSPVPSE